MEYQDDSSSADIHKQGEFCSMCGPRHCPMQTTITDEDLVGLEKVPWSRKQVKLRLSDQPFHRFSLEFGDHFPGLFSWF